MNIITALENLQVEGLEGKHDHIIETVLSKLFFRGDKVHKAHKHRIADFADFTVKDIRRNYIAEDFSWNNVMAPDIYLELRHVAKDGDRFVHTNTNEADDWYIVMKKIDTGRDLTRILEQNNLKDEILASYARKLVERLRTLTELKGENLSQYVNEGPAQIASEVLKTCIWASTDSEPYLSYNEVRRVEVLMQKAFENEEYFKNPSKLSVVIDTNPDNIIFLDDGVSFIDVMPPKDEWRVHDRYFPICRTSADVSALLNAKQAEILHSEYGKHEILPPDTVRIVYELASALIQVPYRKMLKQEDRAKRYANFVRVRTTDLDKILEG